MISSRAAHARNLVGPLIRSAYRIEAAHTDRVPKRGGVVIVCDWNNIAAPTVVKAALPRPVHVWAAGPAALPGPLLSVTGDLAMPEGTPGVATVSRVLELLTQGEAVVAIGAVDIGFVISKSAAPVMAARITAPATKRPTDPPARKSAIDVTMGHLHQLPERLTSPHPTRSMARAAGEWTRQVLVDELGEDSLGEYPSNESDLNESALNEHEMGE